MEVSNRLGLYGLEDHPIVVLAVAQCYKQMNKWKVCLNLRQNTSPAIFGMPFTLFQRISLLSRIYSIFL